MLTLLSPWWLLLLLLAVPIMLLHMRRRHSIIVGSVQIWRQVTSPATAQHSRRIPPFSWPLLLQLLALLLLALALAQPRWQSGPQGSGHLLVVLDNSVAMQATGQMDRAQAELLQELQASGYGSASVLLTGPPAPVLMARVPASNVHAWFKLLPMEPVPAAADWQAIDAAIPGLLQADEDVRLLVLTAPVGQVPELLGGLEPEVRRFANPSPEPWLQDTRVRHTDDGLELQGVLRLPQDHADTVALEIFFRAFGDSDYLAWSQQELPVSELDELPDGLLAFRLGVELPLSGVLRVQLQGQEAGPLTQANHVVHVQPVQARVLLLGDSSPQLVRALAAVPGVALFTAGNQDQADAAEFDLTVTTGLPLQADPKGNSLAFVLPGSDPLLAPLITHWSTDHALSQGVNWATLDVQAAARVPLLPGATEVFQGNGLPLVQARTTPNGRQVVVAFDPDSSNWPTLTGFPAFIGNVLSWVLPRLGAESPLACQAGESCAISGASLGRSTHLESETGSRLEPIQAGPTVLDFVVPLETGVLWPKGSDSGNAAAPVAVNAASVPATVQERADSVSSAFSGGSTTDLWLPVTWLLLLVLLLESILDFSRQRGRPLRGPARRRQLQGLALRATVLILTIVATLNLQVDLPMHREQVAVLVGSNPASDPALTELLNQVAAASTNLSGGESLTVVDYRGSASLLGLAEPTEPAFQGSNLQAGLSLALASLDPNQPARLLLASAGVQTSGDVREVLPQLQARGASVDVLPLSWLPPEEVQVERVLAPAQVYAHDRFTLHVTVTAESATGATLHLFRDGELILTREQDLLAGRNIVELLVSEAEAGEMLFEIEVEAPLDTFVQNNRNGLYVQVLPPARVLIVARQTEWGEVFAEALRLQGLDVTVVLPNRAPFYLDGWLDYRSVVLLDVPSIDLTVRQQELLEQTVVEHGRGLLILGGPNSFGPGGYFETVLERLSPLSSRVPHDAPNVALAFVLDRSGSMQQRVEDSTNRLDIARQATITAAGLLHEESRVSIIVFDSEANVLVPLQDHLDLGEIEQALALLTPGGGTAIYPGLEAAFEQLRGVDAAATHVIVMSDGLSQPGDFETLLGEMKREGITVSVVAIGDGADISSLQRYARMGGGAFHATRDFRALPSILSQESLMLSGAPIEENVVQPAWTSREQPFVQGLPVSVPPVSGFVRTTPKEDAVIHLEVPDAEGEQFPLLASWRYGNGQVLAFASQAAGDWTGDWITRPDYPLFWSQVLRSFLPAASQEGINLTVQHRGVDLHLRVEVLDKFEKRIPGLEVNVNGLTLRETSAGLYQGTLQSAGPGTVELSVRAGELQLNRRFHVAYPAGLDFSLADPEVLANFAEASGGRVLSGGEPLFTGGQRVLLPWPLWPLLLLIGLVLFLLELINRYDPALLRKEARQ